MENIRRLVDALTEWQHAEGLDDAAIGRRLGVSRSMWAAWRLGLRPAGASFVLRVRGVRGFARRADAVLRGKKWPE